MIQLLIVLLFYGGGNFVSIPQFGSVPVLARRGPWTATHSVHRGQQSQCTVTGEKDTQWIHFVNVSLSLSLLQRQWHALIFKHLHSRDSTRPLLQHSATFPFPLCYLSISFVLLSPWYISVIGTPHLVLSVLPLFLSLMLFFFHDDCK